MLMVAIKKCDKKMVKILLARGNDTSLIHIAARNGDTPLHVACSVTPLPPALNQKRLIVDERQDTKGGVKDKEEEKEEEGMEGIVQLLLRYGADYNLPNQQSGKLPLEVATDHKTILDSRNH